MWLFEQTADSRLTKQIAGVSLLGDRPQLIGAPGVAFVTVPRKLHHLEREREREKERERERGGGRRGRLKRVCWREAVFPRGGMALKIKSKSADFSSCHPGGC